MSLLLEMPLALVPLDLFPDIGKYLDVENVESLSRVLQGEHMVAQRSSIREGLVASIQPKGKIGGDIDKISRLVNMYMGIAPLDVQLDVCYENPKAIGQYLVKAAKAGRLDVVKRLLSKGDAISSDYVGNAFIKAASKGHLNVLKELYVNRSNSLYEYVGAALEEAALYGQLDSVRELLSFGLNFTSDEVGSALVQSAFCGHLEVVKELLVNRSDISSDRKKAALWYAVKNGHNGIIQALSPPLTVRPACSTYLPKLIAGSLTLCSLYLGAKVFFSQPQP